MPQPERFEVLVLGSGTGGKLVAWHMAQSGGRTAVVERQWIGGACVNVACMPSKNEIANARVAHLVRHAGQYGTVTGPTAVDMATVRRRKREMVERQIATSIVTVLGSPKAEPAQPRALIGGHLISTFVGLLIVKFFGPGPWATALTVGLAMVAMHLTGTFHPSAGIDPLVALVNKMSWEFLVAPIGTDAMLLALFAFAWHNLVTRGANRGNTRPARW